MNESLKVSIIMSIYLPIVVWLIEFGGSESLKNLICKLVCS